MKTKYFLPILILVGSLQANAQQLEYKYTQISSDVYKCINQNRQEGYNQGLLGECGQVSGQSFDRAELHLYGDGLQAVGSTFMSADFSNARFLEANFKRARFHQSNLDSIYSHKTDFSEATLERASLKGSFLSRTHFTSANLSAANLKGSMISNSNFQKATLERTNFESSSLSSSDFSESSLAFASFKNSLFGAMDFSGANLRGTNFSNCQISSEIIWTGALFNNSTKLPFSEAQALQEGMIKVLD